MGTRNIKSKAAHYETVNHWVHYHCDKLSDVEIHRLANDKAVIYNYKSCLSQNTCPKTVIDIDQLANLYSVILL